MYELCILFLGIIFFLYLGRPYTWWQMLHTGEISLLLLFFLHIYIFFMNLTIQSTIYDHIHTQFLLTDTQRWPQPFISTLYQFHALYIFYLLFSNWISPIRIVHIDTGSQWIIQFGLESLCDPPWPWIVLFFPQPLGLSYVVWFTLLISTNRVKSWSSWRIRTKEFCVMPILTARIFSEVKRIKLIKLLYWF